MPNRDEFDDEGFFDSLLKRKGNAPLPLGLRRIFIVIGILVLISIVAAVAVSAWPKKDIDASAPVPIIRADFTPYKIKPQDPGGMKVPNRDSTIFETLKGDAAAPKTENLLEDESASVEPVARPSAQVPETAPAPVKAGVKPVVVAEAVPVVAAKPDIKPEDTETSATEEAQPSIIETLKADEHPELAKPPIKSPVKSAVKPVVKAAPKPVTSGGSAYIQLAAVKSEAEAAGQWSKFKAKNPELFSLSMRTQKADLGDKGIFYRIQAGPLSAQAATDTCAAVKSRGGSCIIAK